MVIGKHYTVRLWIPTWLITFLGHVSKRILRLIASQLNSLNKALRLRQIAIVSPITLHWVTSKIWLEIFLVFLKNKSSLIMRLAHGVNCLKSAMLLLSFYCRWFRTELHVQPRKTSHHHNIKLLHESMPYIAFIIVYQRKATIRRPILAVGTKVLVQNKLNCGRFIWY